MYIETSSPRQQGDNAKLQVSVSGNGTAACLVFCYHMYGDTMGTLNVYSGNELVFNVSANQGNYWIRARKTIYLRNNVSLIHFGSQEITTVGIYQISEILENLQKSVENPNYVTGFIIWQSQS